MNHTSYSIIYTKLKATFEHFIVTNAQTLTLYVDCMPCRKYQILHFTELTSCGTDLWPPRSLTVRSSVVGV